MGPQIPMTKHGDARTVSGGAIFHVCGHRELKGQPGVGGSQGSRRSLRSLLYSGATPVILVSNSKNMFLMSLIFQKVEFVPKLSWNKATELGGGGVSGTYRKTKK